MYVYVRGQLLGIIFPLPQLGFQGSNAGREMWWKVPFPTELS